MYFHWRSAACGFLVVVWGFSCCGLVVGGAAAVTWGVPSSTGGTELIEAGGGTAPERMQPTAASRSSTRHHRSDRGPASDTMLSHPDFLFSPICPKPQCWFTVLDCNGRGNVCQLRPVGRRGRGPASECADRE